MTHEELRDAVIVALLCSDDFDMGVSPSHNRSLLARVRDGRARHDGDCTNRCHSCLVCLIEEAEKRAEVFIAAMPTGVLT